MNFKVVMPFVLGLALLMSQSAPAKPLDDALLDAAEKGDLKQAKALLKRGANPNAQDRGGVSALMLANDMFANKGQHQEIVDLLLARGASVNLRNRSGQTALSYGCNQDFIKKFVARGGRATMSDSGVLSDWLEAIIWTDSDLRDEEVVAEIRAFVKAGVNLNHRGSDEFNTTPLMNAVESRPSVVRLLLDSGADPNIPDKTGETPLLHAMTATPSASNHHICQLLLERGARVNVRDEWGGTVLMYAMLFGNDTLVQAVLSRGADPNFRNTNGQTALMLCADKGFVEYASLLLKNGAQVNLRDKKDHTALDYAISTQDNQINIATVNSYAPELRSDQEVAERAKQMVKNRQAIEAMLRNRGGVTAKPVADNITNVTPASP